MFLGGLGMGCLGSLMSIGGLAAFIWGCMAIAKGKGYSPWIGLVGFLWILGVVPLLLLPDKHRAVSATRGPSPLP